MEIGIVSSNASKAVEIKEMLKELLPHLTCRLLLDLPPEGQPAVETLSERALRYALFASKEANIPCIVEQSSLQVPILSCEITKAIFSHALQKEQTLALLKAMHGLKSESERAAYIESYVAVATPNGAHKVVCARLEGRIAEKEQKNSSFDFDSIFIKLDYAKPLAELSPMVRRKISCRRKALERVVSFLDTCAIL